MFDNVSDGVFVGFLLSGIVDTLARIEQRLVHVEKKVDAIGLDMTPAERAKIIAQLNADAARINTATERVKTVMDALKNTASPLNTEGA